MYRYVVYFENGTNVIITGESHSENQNFIDIYNAQHETIAFFNMDKIVGVKIDRAEELTY